MGKRVQSPSSINTFKQCKRKYYYNYIEQLPTSKSIHAVRGNIVHSALEDFYDTDVSHFTEESYPTQFKIALQKNLLHQWGNYKKDLEEVNLPKEELKKFFEESMLMLLNWGDHFLQEFKEQLLEQGSIEKTFKFLTPIREQEYRSEERGVRGFIDAIREKDGEVHIIDYKTNKRAEIKDSIKRQLAIYTLLYEEKHGMKPHKVGAFFLREGLKLIEPTQEMVEKVKQEIKEIHEHTDKYDHVFHYPRTVTGLCRWKTGQCDFYETCKPFENR